jgi:hypothetical protein
LNKAAGILDPSEAAAPSKENFLQPNQKAPLHPPVKNFDLNPDQRGTRSVCGAGYPSGDCGREINSSELVKIEVLCQNRGMPSQADLQALGNLIEKAYLAVETDPISPGGIASCRENLKTAMELVKLLTTYATEFSAPAKQNRT